MKTIRRILTMSPQAWEVVIRSLQFTCVLLLCAFALLANAGTYTTETSYVYHLARELATLPQAILLLAAIASAVIEEHQCL